MFSNFLADRPVLKDRLFACAVFSGIAVGGMSGVNMVVTGGFDFLTPGREIRQAAPSSYVTVVPSNWFEQGEVIPMASTEPLFAGQVTPVNQDLDGASDETPVAGHYPAADDGSGDALYHQLAARYDDQAAQTVQGISSASSSDQSADNGKDNADSSDQRFQEVEAQMLQAVPANLVDQKPAA